MLAMDRMWEVPFDVRVSVDQWHIVQVINLGQMSIESSLYRELRKQQYYLEMHIKFGLEYQVSKEQCLLYSQSSKLTLRALLTKGMRFMLALGVVYSRDDESDKAPLSKWPTRRS